ncbi:hypothetical protein [Ekhidna sp.]|uniref:hypothetical protein n=1 Tax=Ekhidna sp. TaxID=2608089 RepID=UPI003BA98085
MVNPFVEIRSRTAIPKDLKIKVEADIDLLRMGGNVGELFITNMGNTACKLLGFKHEGENAEKCDFNEMSESKPTIFKT